MMTEESGDTFMVKYIKITFFKHLHSCKCIKNELKSISCDKLQIADSITIEVMVRIFSIEVIAIVTVIYNWYFLHI